MAVGGMLGSVIARRVEMTQMPELVAAMHSLVGMAAVLIAIAVIMTRRPSTSVSDSHWQSDRAVHRHVRRRHHFLGSVIAFGKLAGLGKYNRLFLERAGRVPGQHWLNLLLAGVMLGAGFQFLNAEPVAQWPPFIVLTAIAFLLGVLIIIPIGGADMPVVISMLNSYSGWAAAGIGFSLDNSMLIIAGSLVGSSARILSYIMCRAMNRSFFSVILGGFGGAEGAVATTPSSGR
jgi:NAD(P) transhydrogenase subunit beta